MEAFLAQRRCADAERQARTAWLLARQRQEQEEVDAEADLAAWLQNEGGGHGRAALLAALADAAADGEQGTLGGGASVAEAAGLAATAAALLLGKASGPGALPALQQQLRGAEQGLKRDIAALEAAAAELEHGSSRSTSSSASCAQTDAAAPCPPPDAGESALQQRVRLLCSRHPLAAPQCAALLRSQAAELEARHAQQAQQRRAAWRAFLGASRAQQLREQGSSTGGDANSCRATADGSGEAGDGAVAALLPAGRTADGWRAEEHAVFVHERSAMAAAAPGDCTAALARRLSALLPWRTGEEVAAHERWHKEAGRLRSAAQQAEAGAEEEAAAFLAAAEALLCEGEARRLAEAGLALRLLDAAIACLQAGEALAQQRDERAAQHAAKGLDQLSAAAAAAAQQAAQDAARNEYQLRMKQLLAEHRERQAAEAAATLAAQRAAEAEAAAAAAAAAAAGRQRVQAREEERHAKQAARAQQEASRAAEAQRRVAALDGLRRQVAPAVLRDAERAMGPTQSREAALAAVEQGHGVFARALGFTSDQVLADQRFKVGASRGGLVV